MLYLLLIILLSNVDRCFLQSDLSTFNSLDQSADQIQGEDEVADLNEQRQRHEGWLISNLLNVLNTTIATGPMPKLELFRFQCISAEQIFGESPNSIFSQGNLHAEFEIRPENGPNEKFILEFKSNSGESGPTKVLFTL